MDDVRLVLRFVKQGDEEAFSQLVFRYEKLVMGVCRRVLLDHGDAEDAFQATFLVLAQKAKTIRDSTMLASWLHGVAYRVALRVARKKGRRKETPIEEPVIIEDSPLENVARRHTDLIVDEELRQMPKGARESMMLYFLNGNSVPEIARRLNLSATAVEGRIKRGKKELGRRLIRRGVAPLALTMIMAVSRQSEGAVSASTIAELAAKASQLRNGSSGQPEVSESVREEVASMSSVTSKSVLSLAAVAGLAVIGSLGMIPVAVGGTGGDPKEEVVSLTGGAGESKQDEAAAQVAVTEASSQQTQESEEGNDEPTPVELIEQKLAETMAVDFPEELTVKQFVELLNQRFGVKIILDDVALEEYGIETDTMIRPQHQEGTLRSLLRFHLRDLELTYTIQDDVLIVTTEEEAFNNLRIKVYDVGLNNDANVEPLLQLITNVIEADDWDDVGGPGHIEPINGKIVVSNTQEVHEKIEELLRTLDKLGVFDDGELYGLPPVQGGGLGGGGFGGGGGGFGGGENATGGGGFF